MNLNKTNKTLIVCLIFILGIASAILALIPQFAGVLLAVSAFFFYKKIVSYRFVIICLLILAFSIFYTNYRTPKSDELARITPSKASLIGIVTTQPKDSASYKTKFEFEVKMIKTDSFDWKPIKAKTMVTIFDKKRKFDTIYVGDKLEITGKIRFPFKATNPGQFDYSKYLQNNGIFTAIYVGYKDFKIIEHPKNGKWLVIQELNKIKNRIISIHAQYLKSPKLEVLGGMVFGDYAVPTPKDIKQSFINSGLLHLLAASGMNVALIFGIWAFIAQKIFIPFRIRTIIGMILVAIYAFLTGLPPSVTRAAWMIEFILFGKLINRQADTVALLALVCSIMLLINPMIITDIGFQLSFIVTLGLLIYMPLLAERTKPVPELISGSILVPVAAQLWVAPIQLYHFNSFATYSVLANILVVPFVAVISFLGFIGSMFCFIPVIGEKLCLYLDRIVDPFITILLYISGYISNLSGVLHYFATPGILAMVLYYILLIILILSFRFNFRKKELNILTLVLILLIIAVSFSGHLSKDLKMIFFDVGEADAILVQTPDRHNILIDTADKGINGFSPANTIIIPYLRDAGINKLDAIILTHPDRDHIGGTIDILKNIKVKEVLDNGEKSDSKVYKDLQKYIKQNDVLYRHVNNIEGLSIAKDVMIKIIKSGNSFTSGSNDSSLITYINYKHFSALLMGDNEANASGLVSKFVNKPVNILKVGHHGSYNSVNENFLGKLKPEFAVISVGNNKYSHPHNKTLQVLNSQNIRTFRTDKDYAIELRTNGRKVNIKRYVDF